MKPVRLGIEFFKKPNAPGIMVLPTAAGKSVIIGAIAKGIEDKVICIQPSKELLLQNYDKFTAMGGRATIYSASVGQKQISPVTYCTIGSVYKLGELFKKFGFTKVIIDEADRFARDMNGMLRTFLASAGITHCLGLTATALKLQQNFDAAGNTFSKLQMLTSRSKKGNFFKEIIHVTQIQEMIEGKWWSKLVYENHDIDSSKLQWNSTKADYTEDSLEMMYYANDLHGRIKQTLMEIPERKSIIVFVPSVQKAKDLAYHTPGSVAVYGDMDGKARERAIRNFKEGITRVIFNCQVLQVGFDHSKVDCIIMARPTASLSLFYQILGRGTRIDPEKKDCLIVDMSGNVTRFGRIEGLRYKKEGAIWKLYNERNELLSGIPLHEIGNAQGRRRRAVIAPGTMPFGAYKGKAFKDIPLSYRQWMISEFQWNSSNIALKLQIQNSL